MRSKADMMRQVVDYVKEHDITEYCTLIEEFMKGGNETAQLFSFASSEVAPVVMYLDSLRRCRGLEPMYNAEETEEFLNEWEEERCARRV